MTQVCGVAARPSSAQQAGVSSLLQALSSLWVRLWTEYSRAGAAVTLPLPPFTSSFFLNMHKRPAKLICNLLPLLFFHPFPARLAAAGGDSQAVVDSPRPESAPGLLMPTVLSWNLLTSSASA